MHTKRELNKHRGVSESMIYIQQLAYEEFYGSLEIKFEGGPIVLIRKTETIKPTIEDYRGNRGIANGQEGEQDN